MTFIRKQFFTSKRFQLTPVSDLHEKNGFHIKVFSSNLKYIIISRCIIWRIWWRWYNGSTEFQMFYCFIRDVCNLLLTWIINFYISAYRVFPSKYYKDCCTWTYELLIPILSRHTYSIRFLPRNTYFKVVCEDLNLSIHCLFC